MSITISDGTTTVTLSDDLYWSDEWWSPVEQSIERSITGALIVQLGTQITGRPITLQGADDSAWAARSVVEQLRNWSTVAGQQLQLTLRGAARTVLFRHQDTAIEAEPIVPYGDVQAGDFYRITLRFMEI
jgi:hypothetical protein